MSAPASENELVTVIEPAKGWELPDFKELKAYRDLFYFLVWRDIKVLYAQTVLGFSWAILNPLIQIIIFSVIFGKVAKIPTDGIPYVLFSTVAIIPWTYMSESMSASSQSLVGGANMLGKVYFPRIIFPLTPILAKLVTWGADRTEAIDRMKRALGEFVVQGIKTSIPFHQKAMRHPVFLAGHYDTGFVDDHMGGGMGEPEEPGDERRVALMMAAIAAYRRDKAQAERVRSVVTGGETAPWKSFGRRSQMRGNLR